MGRSTIIKFDDDSEDAVTRGDTVKTTGQGNSGKVPGEGKTKVDWKPTADALQKKEPDAGNAQGLSMQQTRDARVALRGVLAFKGKKIVAFPSAQGDAVPVSTNRSKPTPLNLSKLTAKLAETSQAELEEEKRQKEAERKRLKGGL